MQTNTQLAICEIEDCEEPASPDTRLCSHHLRSHRLDDRFPPDAEDSYVADNHFGERMDSADCGEV